MELRISLLLTRRKKLISSPSFSTLENHPHSTNYTQQQLKDYKKITEFKSTNQKMKKTPSNIFKSCHKKNTDAAWRKKNTKKNKQSRYNEDTSFKQGKKTHYRIHSTPRHRHHS